MTSSPPPPEGSTWPMESVSGCGGSSRRSVATRLRPRRREGTPPRRPQTRPHTLGRTAWDRVAARAQVVWLGSMDSSRTNGPANREGQGRRSQMPAENRHACWLGVWRLLECAVGAADLLPSTARNQGRVARSAVVRRRDRQGRRLGEVRPAPAPPRRPPTPNPFPPRNGRAHSKTCRILRLRPRGRRRQPKTNSRHTVRRRPCGTAHRQASLPPWEGTLARGPARSGVPGVGLALSRDAAVALLGAVHSARDTKTPVFTRTGSTVVRRGPAWVECSGTFPRAARSRCLDLARIPHSSRSIGHDRGSRLTGWICRAELVTR